MTSALTGLLMAFYVVLAGVSAVDKRWPVCLYWVCAAGITGAVMWMSHRAQS